MIYIDLLMSAQIIFFTKKKWHIRNKVKKANGNLNLTEFQ